MIDILRHHDWESAHQTTSLTGANAPAQICIPKNIDAAGATSWKEGRDSLIELTTAADAAGARLLPLGSGWSLSRVIEPTSRADWLVSTSHLNASIAVGMAGEFLVGGKKKPRFACFQAGMRVVDAHRVLAASRLSLRTSGASSGQTLGGATATGTHGSAFKVGSMHDTILGLHVIGPDGKSLWIQSGSKPVTNQAWANHLGATQVNDDAVFEAALVGLGAFGIVHAILFSCDPLTLFRGFRRVVEIDDLLDGITRNRTKLVVDPDLLELPEKNLVGFDFVLDPNQISHGRSGLSGPVVVQTLFDVGRAPKNYPVQIHTDPRLSRSVDIVHAIAKLANVFHGPIGNRFIRSQTKKVFEELFPSSGGPRTGVLGEIYPLGVFPGGGTSIELGVDAKHTKRALEAVFKRLHRRPHKAVMGMMGVRFVRQSKATLAFTRFPITCTIELPAVDSKRTRRHYPDMCKALADAGIPFTFHWGQWADYSTHPLSSAFPAAALTAWKTARESCVDGPFAFGGKLLQDADLL